MTSRPLLFGIAATSLVLASWMHWMWLGIVILIVIFVAEWRRPSRTPVRIRVKSPHRVAGSN